MKPFYLQLIFFTLFLNILVLGQVPEFTFRNINSDHGLPENIVLDIKEDKMGFLWIATPNYLSRYDGINFKVFPKTFDYRTDYGDFKIGKLLVFEDQLWMITKDGKLEILDLLTEGFQSLDYFIDGSEIPELRSLHIVNKDEIYLGTERNGVYLADHVFNIIKHYDQGAIFSPNRLISNKVNAIHKDALNRLWVLTDQGVNRMHNSNNDVLLDKVNASLLFEENKNHGVICIGSHGDTYFGSFFMGDNFFPSSRYESDGYKIPQDLWINGLYFDSKDRMWSGSMSQGVFIINHGGSYFMKQVMPIENNLNSLADKSILCMYGNGNEGGLWIGTDGGGISFFDEGPEYFKKLKFKETSKNDLLRHVTSIRKDSKKRLWISSLKEGLIVIDSLNQVIVKKRLSDFDVVRFKNDRINDLYVDEDIWIGTAEYGIIIIDKDKLELKGRLDNQNSRLGDNRIRSIQHFNDSLLTVATPSGIYLVDKVNFEVQEHPFNQDDEITSQSVIDSNQIVIGTRKSGVFILNLEKRNFQPLSQDYFENQLSNSPINGLHYVNGWIWATVHEKGIWAINTATTGSKFFNQKDGIPEGVNYGIVAEDSRTLWITYSKGVYKMVFEKIDEHVAIESIQHFQNLFNFQISDYNSRAFLKEVDHPIYFGGISGILSIDPEVLPANKKEVNIVFTDIKVNNSLIHTDQAIPYLKNLELKNYENSLEIAFASPKSSLADDLEYEFRLLGFEEDWISLGNRSFVSFTNLDPGKYNLQIKLAERALESSPITSLEIVIRKAYYQQIWFKILVAFVLFILVYIIYKVRVNYLLEMQQVKDRISADLHDDLGSRLTTIHLLSAISKAKFKKDPEIKDLLNRIDNEIFASSEALHEIVGNIKMNDEDMEEFLVKMRRYISEVLDAADIKYNIIFDEEIRSDRISFDKRREIFSIIKELLNNIRKHSKALKVEFKIGEKDEKFHLMVIDNGVGFNPDISTQRNGLKNLRQRIEKLKGKITIQSESGKGTNTEIWIPFDKKNIFSKIF